MKYLLFFSSFCLSAPAIAQTALSAVGIYNTSAKGDPQGSSTLALLENHRYVIVYVGGAQAGSWSVIQDSVVVFTPQAAPIAFALYGRHNAFLKDSLRIFFAGFTEDRTYLSLGKMERGNFVMQPVYNINPNCFTYPDVYTFTDRSDSILFSGYTSADGYRSAKRLTTFTFNNRKHYNDFIAYHSKEDNNSRPFYALYQKGKLYLNQFPDVYFTDTSNRRLQTALSGKTKLYFDKREGLHRGPLSAAGKDLEFMRALAVEQAIPEQVAYNPYYKEFDVTVPQDSASYTYSPQKGAYLHRGQYKPGEEKATSSDNYNTSNIIYLFTAVKPFASPQQLTFVINDKPLFIRKCK